MNECIKISVDVVKPLVSVSEYPPNLLNILIILSDFFFQKLALKI